MGRFPNPAYKGHPSGVPSAACAGKRAQISDRQGILKRSGRRWTTSRRRQAINPSGDVSTAPAGRVATPSGSVPSIGPPLPPPAVADAVCAAAAAAAARDLHPRLQRRFTTPIRPPPEAFGCTLPDRLAAGTAMRPAVPDLLPTSVDSSSLWCPPELAPAPRASGADRPGISAPATLDDSTSPLTASSVDPPWGRALLLNPNQVRRAGVLPPPT